MATQTKPEPSTDETADTSTRTLPREITKVGNLTADPALEFAKGSGKPHCRFSLAVDHPKEPGNWAGEREVVYYDVTCFDSLAENVCASLEKGCRVIVMGRPEIDEWVDKDGNRRETKRILANAAGPDLRWAKVEVTRVHKDRTGASPVSYTDDEEPF